MSPEAPAPYRLFTLAEVGEEQLRFEALNEVRDIWLGDGEQAHAAAAPRSVESFRKT